MINIAIDGPAGAGKSTIARAVAERLGIIYLDTGAMYRAVAYFVLNSGAAVDDEKAVGEALKDISMDIRYEDGAQQIFVNGENVTPFLREPHMSKAASDVSALPAVRYKMVDLQREFAAKHDVVLDGRDIGTFVLPGANCKFYMTASPEERAARRYRELAEKGVVCTLGEVLSDIEKRDYNDSHRAVAPLKQADDAYFIDTTKLTIPEVVEEVVQVVEKRKNMPEKPVENAAPAASEQPVKTAVTEENAAPAKEAAPANEAEKPHAESAKKRKTLPPPKPENFRFYRFVRALLAPLIKVLWPTEIVHKERFDAMEGGVVICNHYAIPDTLIPVASLYKKELHVLAKAEAFECARIANWFLRKAGAIPVRRGEADINAVKEVLTVLRAGKKLVMYPEGTRNREGTKEMLEFKQGAARFAVKSKKPILPMVYYRMHKVFRKNWLFIGEPIDLTEFYGSRSHEDFAVATERVYECMVKTREQCDAYVAEQLAKKGKKKK